MLRAQSLARVGLYKKPAERNERLNDGILYFIALYYQDDGKVRITSGSTTRTGECLWLSAAYLRMLNCL